MTIEKCVCGKSPIEVVKEKVSVGYVKCDCGCLGPTVSCETHDEADVKAVEAWNAVCSRRQEPAIAPEELGGIPMPVDSPLSGDL